jgi:hypothetical protein
MIKMILRLTLFLSLISLIACDKPCETCAILIYDEAGNPSGEYRLGTESECEAAKMNYGLPAEYRQEVYCE